MADHTKIEWTDATWNPITGCSVHSPGCTNCYAMKLAGTRMKHHPSRAGLTIDTRAGPVWTGEVRFNEQWLDQPLRWKRPRMIFVCAHADLFHEKVPDEWIDRIFAVMALCPQHTFQVLTKRADRMRAYMPAIGGGDTERWARALQPQAGSKGAFDLGDALEFLTRRGPLANVWLGVSIEDQQRADERLVHLDETPAAVKWASVEPLLGPIDLKLISRKLADCLAPMTPETTKAIYNEVKRPFEIRSIHCNVLDWVVVGGESGAHARPMHPDWTRSLRDQCAAARVPFLFKQWGEWAPSPDGSRCVALDGANMPNLEPRGSNGDGTVRIARLGKKAAGRMLDGIEHNGFPS
jgi:protein gp37